MIAGSRYALGVLFAINLMNFFDRQILGAVGEQIRREWNLGDAALGALGTAFTLLGAMYLAGASLGPVGTGIISDDFTSQAATVAGVTDRSIRALEPFRGAGLHAAMYVVPILVSLLALVLFGASRTVTKVIEALHVWTADELQAVPLINR
jgi:hypothetical protein